MIMLHRQIVTGAITSLLTAVFISSLGLGLRAYELGNKHETRIVLLEDFARRQDILNKKLDKYLEMAFTRR